jgi:hypothetical protein
MNKLSSIAPGIVLAAALLLPGCASTVHVTVADATTLTTFSSEKYIWEQVKENSEGTINIQDTGFYYKLVDGYDKNITFHGVTFVPDYAAYLISQGRYIVGSFIYYMLATFEDGTKETLFHVGLFLEQYTFIGISKHHDPYAGVMQIRDDSLGGIYTYLLVSVTG